jgi:hypothetical protein
LQLNVADGAWQIWRFTSWIVYSPGFPYGSEVLSLPYALRYRLAYDASLITGVLNGFTKAVFEYMIQQARDFGATQRPQCGAVTFIQRFDSALRLNVHFHMVAIDGMNAGDESGHPQFHALLSPSKEEETRGLDSHLHLPRIPEIEQKAEDRNVRYLQPGIATYTKFRTPPSQA